MSDISQGSVETHMRCGGVFSNSVSIQIFFLIPIAIKIENRCVPVF